MIAKTFVYSKTRACELKMEAERLGYLSLVQHDEDIMLLAKADRRLRDGLEAEFPGLIGKIRFETIYVERNGRKWKMIRIPAAAR